MLNITFSPRPSLVCRSMEEHEKSTGHGLHEVQIWHDRFVHLSEALIIF